MDDSIKKILDTALPEPAGEAVARSRKRTGAWFEGEAPLIRWDVIETPLGLFYAGMTGKGVCSIVFGQPEADFFATLDPMARTERNPDALANAMQAIRDYFEHPTDRFDLPLDLSRAAPFHRQALEIARGIRAGEVWTYKHLAEAVGKPKASRAIGQAMARNPVPIIIPCHRVVGSSGKLTGYGGGGGIPTKKWLLEYEGARW